MSFDACMQTLEREIISHGSNLEEVESRAKPLLEHNIQPKDVLGDSRRLAQRYANLLKKAQVS